VKYSSNKMYKSINEFIFDSMQLRVSVKMEGQEIPSKWGLYRLCYMCEWVSQDYIYCIF